MTEQHVEETVEDQEITPDNNTEQVSHDGSPKPADETVDEEATNQEDTFPRSYVEKLRDENAKYRQRAQQSDDLAQRLHTALVDATGALQDPTDLAFDEAHLDDVDALQQAIDDLVAKKPHLAARRPAGDIGQGQIGSSDTVDLAGILRSQA